MKSQAEIEQILEQLGNEWPSECSLMDGVLRRIEAQSAGLEPRRVRRPVIKWLLAMAASLAVVAALWWIFRGDSTLYAQAIDGIRRARTVHLTAIASPDAGNPAKQVREAWYERGVGFREELGSEVRLGNQENFWTYTKGSSLAIRSKSRGVDDIVDRVLDSDALHDFEKFGQVERYSEGDQTVGNQPCRAYLLTNLRTAVPGKTDNKWRSVMLLDDRSHMRRLLNQSQAKDDWAVRTTIDFEYDVPVDRALFQPNFGDNVKIVDADKAFDEFVDLDKAVYREERSGLWFAIHRLQRFQDGIFIVSSVRGTEETLKKYPLKQLFELGQSFLVGPAANYEASPQGSGYFRIDLARVDYQGVNVCWWVLVPRGVPLNHFNVAPGLAKLPLAVTPHGEFAKDKFSKNGVINHLYWDVILSLPESVVLPTVQTIAAEAYADLIALESIRFRRLDLGAKDNIEQFGDPEKTTVVEFASAVEANIRTWRAQDIAFQLEGQFAGAKQGNVGDDEAIGLSYEPAVDDATMKQIVKRQSLKRLYLDCTKITDAGLKQLVSMKELRELSLAHTSITDAGLKELEALASLRLLNVEDTKVTDDGVARLTAAIPGLKVNRGK